MSRKKTILYSRIAIWKVYQKRLIANSEVQLKDRFKKWHVKKYIPENDLKIMLSIKRKRQAIGDDAHFQWRGRNIEQERIERASKRIKGPLLSPKSELLSHIDRMILIPVLSDSGSYQSIYFTASNTSKCST